jgi:SAM-dependent methyltransferase
MPGSADPADARPPHARDPLRRFTARADDYARGRPGYPEAAWDAVLAGLGTPAGLVAADVGAGTGIAARALAARGVRVVAVEPNAAMREAASPHPLVSWRAGSAEATGLPDAGTDLVVCAQSFHWFRPAEALAEFRRVLRPGGRVALLWNVKREGDATTAAYYALVREAAVEDPAHLHTPDPVPLLAAAGFAGARRRVFPNAQRLDADGLVARALSASYVPRLGPAHERLVAGLRALHARARGGDGLAELAYDTEVFLAESASR